MNNHNCSNNGVPRINSTYTPAIACTILFFDNFTRANKIPRNPTYKGCKGPLQGELQTTAQ